MEIYERQQRMRKKLEDRFLDKAIIASFDYYDILKRCKDENINPKIVNCVYHKLNLVISANKFYDICSKLEAFHKGIYSVRNEDANPKMLDIIHKSMAGSMKHKKYPYINNNLLTMDCFMRTMYFVAVACVSYFGENKKTNSTFILSFYYEELAKKAINALVYYFNVLKDNSITNGLTYKSTGQWLCLRKMGLKVQLLSKLIKTLLIA